MLFYFVGNGAMSAYDVANGAKISSANLIIHVKIEGKYIFGSN
jgi:hypothetical protein